MKTFKFPGIGFLAALTFLPVVSFTYTQLSASEWKILHSNTGGVSHGVFVSRGVAWFECNSTVYKSENEGESRFAQNASCNSSDQCKSIDFLDINHGYSLFKYMLYTTNNGGLAWDITGLPGTNIRVVKFLSENIGVVAAKDTIYRTTDKGSTWERAEMDSLCRIIPFAIYFADSLNGWAAGYSSIAFGAGIIVGTIDGGKTWKFKKGSYEYYGIFGCDQLQFCAVGICGMDRCGVLSNTLDGGKTFTTFFDYQTLQFNDVAFINKQHGFVVGQKGCIIETTDSGKTWKRVTNVPITEDLVSISATDRACYIVSKGGTILKYEYSTNSLHLPVLSSRPGYPACSDFIPCILTGADRRFNPAPSCFYDCSGRKLVSGASAGRASGLYVMRVNGASGR